MLKPANPFWQAVEQDPDLVKHPNRTYYVLPSTLGPAAKGQPKSTGEKDLRRAQDAKRAMILAYAKLDPNYIPTMYPEVADRAWTVRQEKGTNRESTKYQARPLYEKLKAMGTRYAEEVLGQKELRLTQADDTWWAWLIEEIKKEPTEGVREDGTRWKKRPRKTFANLRKCAVQIDNFAFRNGLKKNRSDFRVSDPKAREGRVITDEQFQKIIAATVPSDEGKKAPGDWKLRPTAFRIQAFLFCARSMGMRRSEILGLETHRVDLVEKFIRLEAKHTKTGSKTKKGRDFAIAPEAEPFLFQLVSEAQARGDKWLFPNRKGTDRLKTVSKPILSLRRKTGIDFRPHDLRHTFLTVKLLVEKLPPMDVAIYAGVSLKVMQDTYLHPKVDDTRYVVTGIRREAPALQSGQKARALGSGNVEVSGG